MSVLVGNGMLVTFMDTEITCPICASVFDASKKIDAAKYPLFNTWCPKCKGKITISVPIFGGNTKCWETNPPKTKKDLQLKTETPFTVNGKAPKKRLYDNNEDEDDEEVEV